MTDITELDDALSAALNSLAAAQAVLRKSRAGPPAEAGCHAALESSAEEERKK
jgi:hypothetical protein